MLYTQELQGIHFKTLYDVIQGKNLLPTYNIKQESIYKEKKY